MSKVTKRLQKITNCLGSVFIGIKNVRVLALLLVAITVVTSTICYAKGPKTEKVNVETYANNQSNEAKKEETIDPNSITKYGTKAEKLLNTASLTPMLTGEEDVDSKVQKIMDETIDDTMSNYEKVQALYLYVATHYKYKSSFIYPKTHYSSRYDQFMVGRAKGILTTGHGTCTEFSAVFMVMMRRLGFECYCIEGTFYKSGQHTWTIMVLDGERYIFDPEIEYCMISKHNHGECYYEYFCLSEEDSNHSKYRTKKENSTIASFKNFEREAPLVAPIPGV